ncbi:MAG: UbiD family decarboxylase [Candidatus Lightella neohaematopini]|nr:UbiD family decarboxylase [Candidatus Lightella neohaematopini]
MFKDLKSFLKVLEYKKQIKIINELISPFLEVTEISRRVLKKNGPALLFNNLKGYNIPLLCNLFGSIDRIMLGLGINKKEELRDIGNLIVFLQSPTPPNSFYDLIKRIPKFRQILNMPTKTVKLAPCQELVLKDSDVDLNNIPIMHCWPDDAGPLITWGITITKGLNNRQNLGVYRQQVIDKNKVIIRWLHQRDGALDFKKWQKLNNNKKFPVAIAIGVDPATAISAVAPLPSTLSEYSFAGLLRKQKTELVKCISCDLQVPANAEIILEGYLKSNYTATEGPHGDHTGYYNEKDKFPVLTITHITKKHNTIYHSTYTSRPPDEPSKISEALNEIFIPIIKNKFPEVKDFYLPSSGCSYRLAIVSIKKEYAGHAKIIMIGIWSFLKQFMYNKYIIVCDDDINIRKWNDVIWAITTRTDPIRDTLILNNMPIDYLDFASQKIHIGSKMGIDATNKWLGEVDRKWGKLINMNKDIEKKIDQIWKKLNI